LRLATVEAVIAAGFHLQVASRGVTVGEQVVEIKVRRAGGTHLRYDKKFELYLGGVGKAGVREFVEHFYAAVEGAREATVEICMWSGYAYWKLVDEASMLKYSKMQMKAPSGFYMKVDISKQTREAKEKKRKAELRHGTPGLGVQQVRTAVREAVREELTGGGEDNPIRKQTRRALCDESKEGGALTAAAIRGRSRITAKGATCAGEGVANAASRPDDGRPAHQRRATVAGLLHALRRYGFGLRNEGPRGRVASF
jgi:hypothetical protein